MCLSNLSSRVWSSSLSLITRRSSELPVAGISAELSLLANKRFYLKSIIDFIILTCLITQYCKCKQAYKRNTDIGDIVMDLCMSSAPCNSLFLSKTMYFGFTLLLAVYQLLTLSIYRAKEVNCLQYLNCIFLYNLIDNIVLRLF